jgi:hypothetical protein
MNKQNHQKAPNIFRIFIYALYQTIKSHCTQKLIFTRPFTKVLEAKHVAWRLQPV